MLVFDHFLTQVPLIRTHELVILEVLDDDLHSAGPSGALGDGGKGLSLKEAVIGRKVVSKFLIDEIDFIDIEHSAAICGNSEIRDVERNSQELGEFWQGCHTAVTYDPLEMSQRWCNVDEDRLKIHFTGGCGTLYLRLFADLKEKEAGKDTLSIDNTLSLLSNVGTETKIWCRTIARYATSGVSYTFAQSIFQLTCPLYKFITGYVELLISKWTCPILVIAQVMMSLETSSK